MSLKQRIEDDFIKAVRQKEALKVSCLRLVKAAVKNKEIDKRGELDDDQIIAVLQTLAKQRRESIEHFEKGGRQDLVAQEKGELAILEGYLPQALPDSELEKLIVEIVEALKAEGPKDMGRVMKEVMAKAKGRADGKKISELVKKKLGGGQ